MQIPNGPRSWRALVPLAMIACFVLAGCGSSSSSTAGTSSQPVSTAASASTAQVQAFVARYTSKPTAFPVNAPLTKTLSGKPIAYLECGTPYCALLAQIYKEAAGDAHVPLLVVNGGTTASSLQSALASIAAKKPAALLIAGVNLSTLGDGLSKLGVPVVSSAVFGTKAQGISADVNGSAAVALGGKLLADWAIATAGPKANVVWYTIPELGFTTVETSAFKAEMTKSCPSCKVDIQSLPAASIGTTAPSQVVSYVQSHPSTDVALFSSEEAAEGLPTALKSAGLSVKIGGYASTPENLQDEEQGSVGASIGLDTGVMAFTQVDEAIRLATGQPLTSVEDTQTPVLQLLTQQNLKGPVAEGWSGYPDFVARFKKLWTAAA